MYEDITDRSNPFNITGISAEDHSMLRYLQDAKRATGVDVVVTCTTDHPTGATRHLQPGTNGKGLAIDCRLRTRGNNIHKAVFDLFQPVEGLLYELIYSGAKYNIKAGKKVAPYAVSGHWDHVHVAVPRSVMIGYRRTSSKPPTKEEDMTPEQATRLIQEVTDSKNYLVALHKQNETVIDLLRQLVAKS